jgi:predicted transcriptional regulator of viral defense system
MEFERLLEIVGDEPAFETGLLLAGSVSPADVRRQLSHWVKAGRLFQLRRGLYVLAPPFQKVKPHPFLLANRLKPSSYVSLQSALAFYSLIPEAVPWTTSVTTARPARWQTALGSYSFRHVAPELFFGYDRVEVNPDQQAFVAWPEKALLDLVYLQPGGDSPRYLQELRLQNLERLGLDRLQQVAVKASKPKLRRAAQVIAVKIEVDTNPPAGAGLATTVVRRYVTLQLQHHDRSSLLAGKLHAIL